MENRDLEQLIKKRETELAELRRQIERAKYAKHMNALLDALCGSDSVLEVISNRKLNADDCKFVGRKIGEHFPDFVAALEDEIGERMAKRARKSLARQERRTRQIGAATARNQPGAVAEGVKGQEQRIY